MRSDMSDVLRVEGLVAGYADLAVVRDLRLSVGPNEIVALLGANGAGKTTTLLTISGLLAPMAGEIVFLDHRIDRLQAHNIARLGVGHVTSDRALFYGLTTRENLALGTRKGGLPLDAVLDWFPALEGFLDRRTGLLSGGEQQMVALARALVGRPRLLMVDEMSLGLAPLIVDRLLDRLRQLASEAGFSVLLVEQHVNLALDLADRVYVLSRGMVTYEGSPTELRKNPELVEAAYLGTPTAASAHVNGGPI
jgi:branched-chain amino acid transport system ATP-binding protein